MNLIKLALLSTLKVVIVGHTYAKINLHSPHHPPKSIGLKLIVDTGSAYTWVRRDKLTELEIEPYTERNFRTIRGELIKREVGEAIVSFDRHLNGLKIPRLEPNKS